MKNLLWDLPWLPMKGFSIKITDVDLDTLFIKLAHGEKEFTYPLVDFFTFTLEDLLLAAEDMIKGKVSPYGGSKFVPHEVHCHNMEELGFTRWFIHYTGEEMLVVVYYEISGDLLGQLINNDFDFIRQNIYGFEEVTLDGYLSGVQFALRGSLQDFVRVLLDTYDPEIKQKIDSQGVLRVNYSSEMYEPLRMWLAENDDMSGM